MSKFEAGKKYGNDLTIEVVKRTAKFITIKTSFGTNRVKINSHGDCEVIYFKCWVIEATDNYDKDQAQKEALYRAYYL